MAGTAPLKRVLIVDDDPAIRSVLSSMMADAGLRPSTASDGESALRIAAVERPHLLLLDLAMPALCGIQVCRQVRSDPELRNTWIIMITASGAREDRLAALEAGVDDFISKPFSAREVVLRVQTALRRLAQAEPVPSAAALTCGPLRVDLDGHRAWLDSQELALSHIEFRLLTHLVRRRDSLCSRHELLRDVWETPAHLKTRTVDAHVKRLRRKLGPIGDAMIQTVRGSGYRLVSECRDAEETSVGG